MSKFKDKRVFKFVFFPILFLTFLMFISGLSIQKGYLEIFLRRNTYLPEHLIIKEIKLIPRLKAYDENYQVIVGKLGDNKYRLVVKYQDRKEGDNIPIWYSSKKGKAQIKVRKVGESTFDFAPYAMKMKEVFFLDNLPFIFLFFIYLIFLKKHE